MRSGDAGLRIIPAPTVRGARRENACAGKDRIYSKRFRLACVPRKSNECGVCRDTMTNREYTFRTSPEQLRRLGARGGRAYGRNQRARSALGRMLPEAVPQSAVPPTTTAESIAILDARFPWLRGAEKQTVSQPA